MSDKTSDKKASEHKTSDTSTNTSTNTSTVQLLPCPFCGGEMEMHISALDAFRNVYSFQCKGCDMEIIYPYSNEEEAVKAFNTRKPMERIVERLEALRAEHEEREKDARKVGLTKHADLNGIKAYIYDDAIEIVKEEGAL